MANDNAKVDAVAAAALNGSAVPMSKAGAECVSLLRGLLAEAEAGQIEGIACAIATGPEGSRAVAAGTFVATLVLGLERIKSLLIAQSFGEGRPKSSLVLPGVPRGRPI